MRHCRASQPMGEKYLKRASRDTFIDANANANANGNRNQRMYVNMLTSHSLITIIVILFFPFRSVPCILYCWASELRHIRYSPDEIQCRVWDCKVPISYFRCELFFFHLLPLLSVPVPLFPKLFNISSFIWQTSFRYSTLGFGIWWFSPFYTNTEVAVRLMTVSLYRRYSLIFNFNGPFTPIWLVVIWFWFSALTLLIVRPLNHIHSFTQSISGKIWKFHSESDSECRSHALISVCFIKSCRQSHLSLYQVHWTGNEGLFQLT